MREELEKISGQSMYFTAQYSYMSKCKQFACFSQLKKFGEDKILADHIWMRIPIGVRFRRQFIYKFHGKVGKYFKPREDSIFDYQISQMTHIHLLKK